MNKFTSMMAWNTCFLEFRLTGYSQNNQDDMNLGGSLDNGALSNFNLKISADRLVRDSQLVILWLHWTSFVRKEENKKLVE
jgi:hypothetical protein